MKTFQSMYKVAPPLEHQSTASTHRNKAALRSRFSLWMHAEQLWTLNLSEFESPRLEHFGFHQNHLKVFACLNSCFPVFLWIFTEIFTQRSRLPRSSDMEKRASRAAAALFESWKIVQIASNWVKIPKLLQKNSAFRVFRMYFFDALSCFRIFFPTSLCGVFVFAR